MSILVDIRDGLHEESSVINITYGKNTKVYSKNKQITDVRKSDVNLSPLALPCSCIFLVAGGV